MIGSWLARGHLNVRYLGDEIDPAATVASESGTGDVIVTLGAGDVYKLGEQMLAMLGHTDASVTVKARGEIQ